jgi:hypothetical protein
MAYIYVRRGSLNPNTLDDAIEWSTRIGKAASRAMGRDLTVMMPTSGDRYAVLWTFSLETMGELDDVATALTNDAEYQALGREAQSKGYLTSVSDTTFVLL